VALEAATCGIPTIANDTPGLVEALGDAGTYPSAYTVEAWEAAISGIKWAAKSKAARKRFEALDTEGELLTLEAALYRLAARA
jgi:glycosyltransferase involved in cell wall biosynthesis